MMDDGIYIPIYFYIYIMYLADKYSIIYTYSADDEATQAKVVAGVGVRVGM